MIVVVVGNSKEDVEGIVLFLTDENSAGVSRKSFYHFISCQKYATWPEINDK